MRRLIQWFFSKRLFKLLNKITFSWKEGQNYWKLIDEGWFSSLAFLVNVTCYLYNLNKGLQGKYKLNNGMFESLKASNSSFDFGKTN